MCSQRSVNLHPRRSSNFLHCRLKLMVGLLFACLTLWFYCFGIIVNPFSTILLYLTQRRSCFLSYTSHARINVSTDFSCKFPHLMIDDPVIRPFLRTYDALQCSNEANWISTSRGKFYITATAEGQHGGITCSYKLINRKDEESFDAIPLGAAANGTPVPGEVFTTSCSSSDGATYENLHVSVAFNRTLHERKDTLRTPRLDLNVYLYVIDSMSRINFIRKLPKFYQLLTSMDALIMKGFNIVGDGTPWNMIPLVTGHFQTELYEARKRFENASTLDEWPLIFKDYKAAGYVTGYAEEQPQFSFFSYKLKGFKDPPVDYYLRYFEQAANAVKYKHKPLCLGDTPKAIVLCRWWRELQDMYSPSNVRTFSLLFASEASHDDYNYVQVWDEHLEKVFADQFRAGYFNNTLLVIMSDHGRRFGAVRQTQSGKVEEKLPFLAIVPPPWFRTLYPKSYRNLQINTDRLTTSFDVHATLKTVINFTEDGGQGRWGDRGISLFQNIPIDRTCRHASIKPHFCACLAWQDLATNRTDVLKAAAFIVGQFNQHVTEAKNACVPLQLDRILSAQLLLPSQSLMSFKESADIDNIYPDLTASTDLAYAMYQLRFTTLPAGADFEVSVTYFCEEDNFRMSFADVSRLDMYGDQPRCIMDTYPQLRQYCVCWDYVLKKS